MYSTIVERNGCVQVQNECVQNACETDAFAQAITSKDAELIEKWRKTLLSAPAVFIRLDSDEKIFGEANSLRQELNVCAVCDFAICDLRFYCDCDW